MEAHEAPREVSSNTTWTEPEPEPEPEPEHEPETPDMALLLATKDMGSGWPASWAQGNSHSSWRGVTWDGAGRVISMCDTAI